MITLKEIELKNAQQLGQYIYKDKTLAELENIILSWKNKTFGGKYFEMLGIFNEENFIGLISLAEQTKNSVSIGIEIFESFRRAGYGYKALTKALDLAKEKGYKLTFNQVRTDNVASITLCEKCQLESNFYEYKNKKGNSVYLFVKQL